MTDTEEYFLVREVKKIADLEHEIKELKERIDKLENTKVTFIPIYPPYPVYPTWPTYPDPYRYTWCGTTDSTTTVTM